VITYPYLIRKGGKKEITIGGFIRFLRVCIKQKFLSGGTKPGERREIGRSSVSS
jgi:hypothetical protein